MPRLDRRLTPLSITGLGCVTALGHSPEQVLDALEAGESGIRDLLPDEVPNCQARLAARVVGFDSGSYLPAMRARRLDRASLFAVAAVKQALDDARFPEDQERNERLGLVMGTSSAGSGPLTTFLEAAFRISPLDAPPSEFPNTVANAPAGHVSIELGLKGPSTTLTQKQSVVAPALLYAQMMIALGRCNAVLAGTTDEWCAVYQRGYDQLGALRIEGESSQGDGMVLAEGAATVLLESEAYASRRGSRPFARLLGVGMASSPGATYRWVPDSEAMVRAILLALEEAGLQPPDVGSVWLAANGVAAMESIEASALQRVFPRQSLVATGLKGALGECATSGAASVALAALARQRKRLPPFSGPRSIAWPASVGLLDHLAPSPDGATLVLTYGAGGTFGAILIG